VHLPDYANQVLRQRVFQQVRGGAGVEGTDSPSYDEGYCDQDRRHLASLTTGYETPEVGSGVARVLASRWRLSGILTAQSGDPRIIQFGIKYDF
jgi:hypothetical protein